MKPPSGQGGMGFALGTDLSAFADRTPALTLTVGPGNRAQAILVALHDATTRRTGSRAGLTA